MKFIKKIKKLTKSWAHRHRIGCAHTPQYLHGVACATHYCVRRAALIVAAAAMRCLRDGERGDKSNTVGVASWSARGSRVMASPVGAASCCAARCAGLRRRAGAGAVLRRAGAGCRRAVRCPGAVLAAPVLAGSHAAPLVLAAVLRRAGAGRRAAPLGTVPGGSLALLARLPCWPACPAGLAGRRAAGGLAGRRPGCSRAAAGKGLAGTNIAHAPVAAEKNFFTPSG